VATFNGTGAISWSEAPIDGFTTTITLPNGSNGAFCCVAGWDYTGDTITVTIDGQSPDDEVAYEDGGGGISLFGFADPTTGSSVTVAPTGFDDGDDNQEGYLHAIDDIDADELASTGFPLTDGPDTADPTSFSPTVAVGDFLAMGSQANEEDDPDVWDTTAGDERHEGQSWGTGMVVVTFTAVDTSPTVTTNWDQDHASGLLVVFPTAAADSIVVLRRRIEGE